MLLVFGFSAMGHDSSPGFKQCLQLGLFCGGLMAVGIFIAFIASNYIFIKEYNKTNILTANFFSFIIIWFSTQLHANPKTYGQSFQVFFASLLISSILMGISYLIGSNKKILKILIFIIIGFNVLLKILNFIPMTR